MKKRFETDKNVTADSLRIAALTVLPKKISLSMDDETSATKLSRLLNFQSRMIETDPQNDYSIKVTNVASNVELLGPIDKIFDFIQSTEMFSKAELDIMRQDETVQKIMNGDKTQIKPLTCSAESREGDDSNITPPGVAGKSH